MREFHSPRTRWFSVWRFRRVFFPVATIALFYTSLVLLMPGARHTAVASPAALAPPPVIKIAPEHSSMAELSLREMFRPRPPADAEIPAVRKTLAVGRGDTLMNLLVRNHVPRDEAYQAIAAMAKVYDPRDLNPAHRITVFFNPAADAPKFSGLTIQKDVVSTVSVSRDAAGRYTAGEKAKKVHDEMRAFRGKIDDSLFVSAENAGMPDGVILDLIKMYSYNVDFQRDVHAGDAFEVMYSAPVTEDGSAVRGREQIVFARLTLGGREMPLYYYKDSSGDGDYFDDKGQGVKKPLMKTPVDGARLSSGFGMRRHPVLGYSKMHKGIDFAAPRGTPIYAAGDAVIERMGPFSTYGNYVKLRHRSGLETAYAHMQGFKAGLHSGMRVKQGQVIGYIGTTGRSTGPHLHYEIIINGAQVNPATVKIAGGKAVASRDMKRFRGFVGATDRTFRELGANKAVASIQKTGAGNSD